MQISRSFLFAMVFAGGFWLFDHFRPTPILVVRGRPGYTAPALKADSVTSTANLAIDFSESPMLEY